MISSIVLFLRRAKEEVGPVVEAPRLLEAAVPFCAVVLVAAGVSAFAPPKMELLAGAVVEVDAAVLPGAVAVLDMKGLGGLVGSDVAALEAGLPKSEPGCVEAAAAVFAESVGLFRLAKGEAAYEEAIGADVPAGAAVESLFSVGLVVVLIPPKRDPAGLAAAVSAAGFVAWLKRELPEEAGAAPVLCMVGGFAVNRLPGAEEPSAGFVPPNKFEAGFAA